MPSIHLIEGPVGAGKSTYALRLSRELAAPHLDLDDWMVVLFRPDRPDGDDIMDWYLERKDRCIEQIWQVALEVLSSGSDVVLELGLVRRLDREAFFARVDMDEHPLLVHALDAPREVRRERVRTRNRERGATHSMDVSDAVFERASDIWEPLDDAECARREVRFVDTSGPVSGAGAGAGAGPGR